MEKVFEIYIKTTPERLWEAIVDSELRRDHAGLAALRERGRLGGGADRLSGRMPSPPGRRDLPLTLDS